jgi:hypothetical protein
VDWAEVFAHVSDSLRLQETPAGLWQSTARWDNLRPVVRLSTVFIWITVVAFVAAVVSQMIGWEAVRTVIVSLWLVVLLLVLMTRGMRWTSGLTYLSAASLLGAVISQLAGWETGRAWFLLGWAVLMLPVAVALASHPMRRPALGMFIGFWGVVGILCLIVVQIFAVSGVLAGEVYRDWAAWPLALTGVWFVGAASLGMGCEEFPRWIDGLGLLAGAGLIGISVMTWVGAPSDVVRAVGLVAAIAYCAWAVGLGRVLWGTPEVTHRFFGLSTRAA